jgi:hypothetical protein
MKQQARQVQEQDGPREITDDDLLEMLADCRQVYELDTAPHRAVSAADADKILADVHQRATHRSGSMRAVKVG